MSVASISLEAAPESSQRDRRVLTRSGLGLTICIDAVAGYVAWHLVQPGQSLLGPLFIVGLILAAPFVGWWIYLRSLPIGRRRRVLSVDIAVLLTLPLLWTYFGVLPASVGLDAAATRLAQSEISSSTHGCRVVSGGSIGLLRAPYEICSVKEQASSLVFFSTLDRYRGYAYIQRNQNLNWFPDECARQLDGHWWAFFGDPVAVVNGCPFGYSPHGGA